MIKKVFKGLMWLILILVLLVVLASGYLLASNHGLQQLLALGKRHAPGELQWDKADGALTGPLILNGFSYSQPDGLAIELESGRFDWTPVSLLKGEVRLTELAISGLDITAPEPAEEAEPEPSGDTVLPDIRLPVRVALENIDISDIRLRPHGASEPILINGISLGADANEEQFQLLQLDVNTPEARLAVSGKIQARDAWPMDIVLDWDYSHPEFGDFNGQGTLAGTLESLSVKHKVGGPLSADLNMTLSDILQRPAWDGKLRASSVSLGRLVPAAGETPLDAIVTTQGTAEGYTAIADIVSDHELSGPVSVDLELAGDTSTLQIENLLLTVLTGPARMVLQGDVDLESAGVDLTADWQSLGWPLTGESTDFLSPEGRLTLSGSADNLQADVSAAVEGAAFGRLQTAISTQVSDGKVEVPSVKVTSPDSDVSIVASAQFDPESQQFSADGTWDGLDLPLQGEPVIRQASGKISASGQPENYQFDVSGDLSGAQIPPLAWTLVGTGTSEAINSFTWTGDTLDGQVLLTGEAGWSPQVAWDLQLGSQGINPAVQWSDWPGRVNASVGLQGALAETGLQLTALIEEIGGTLKNQTLTGVGEIQVDGDAIRVDPLNLALGNTTLSASGSLQDTWDLDWQLSTPDISRLLAGTEGSIDAKGELRGSRELPELSAKLQVNDLQSGDMAAGWIRGDVSVSVDQNKRSSLNVNAEALQVAGYDWQSLKLTGAGTPAKHTVSAELKGSLLDFSTQLAGGLDETSLWLGSLQSLSLLNTELGDWTLKSPARLLAGVEKASLDSACLSSVPAELCLNGSWSANQGANGILKLTNLDSERFSSYLPESIVLDTKLSATASGSMDAANRIKAKADLDFSGGSLTVSPESEPQSYSITEGSLIADMRNDSLQSSLAVTLGTLGKLASDTRIRNLSKKPSLSGTVKTQIDDLSIISAFAPQIQAVTGTLLTDLALSGTLDSPGVDGVIALSDFSAEVPEYALLVENTRFEARSDNNGPLILSGESHSGGGTLSFDGQFQPKTRSLEISVTGDDFQVANSNQIKARISPAIDLSMNDAGMTVSGELLVPSAYINANGGNSDIETVGTSSDVEIVEETAGAAEESGAGNLTMNLRIALGDDIRVEAGDFRGALKGSLQVEQTPELAPLGTGTIEVVNGDYVIYGQQLKMQRGKILFGGGPVDNPQLDMDVARTVEAYDVVAGARIRGTAQSPQLQLYSEPSMPDASILSYMLLGQPPGTTGGSYTVGKYLTPDLYVSYGIGLFNAINTFNMRYSLTEKLAVQAASSTASSADFVYTIEK